MMTLDMIISNAFNNRDDIADCVADAFSNTLSYKFVGKYYPATRWEPEEYPDVEVDGYDDYVNECVSAVMGIFGDSWDNKDEQLVVDNIATIMSDIDVDFMDENTYWEKGVDYAYDHYWEEKAEAQARAEDAYYERLIDQKLEERWA